MHILRKITLWFTSAVFRFFLLTTAIVGTIVMLFGTPIHIKQILKDNDVYSNFVDGIIADARKSPDAKSNDSFPINDPVFQKAIKSSFTPEFLQTSTENVVDGTYHWLNGKTAEPDFRIDVSGPKKKFANAIGDYAVTKLSALPICNRQQLRQLQLAGGTIDPFSATCRPPGFNVADQKAKVVSKILSDKDFLNKSVITANSLKKDQGDQNFFEDKRIIPKVYGWINISPFIMGVILLLLATAIVFLHETKRKGLRSVGLRLTETGVFLGVVGLITAILYRNASKPDGPIGKAIGSNSFQQTISKVLTAFVQLFNARLVVFGLIYIVIGSIILVYLYLSRDKNPTASKPTSTSKPPTPPLTSTKPTKVKVQ
ncbi:MAG TPA: hypothetical protein VLF39_04125 [Candidatus Saccharimonadales bacterium]|nr:hypothetical protein [Candidatus Saccharimonadales bacterium]